MIINGIDNIDVEKLMPGDTVILKIVSNELVREMCDHVDKMGCKLIFLQYGKFYIKDDRYIRTNILIDEILDSED